MDRDRLVDQSLGQINKGLLIFRLGLYAAVSLAVLQRDAPWGVVALVAAVAFLPAVSRLPHKIEIGVAATLAVEFALTLALGALPALQVMALFSMAVAGLLLSRRVALGYFVGAAALQGVVIFAFAMGKLPGSARLSDLIAESLLLAASGITSFESAAYSAITRRS